MNKYNVKKVVSGRYEYIDGKLVPTHIVVKDLGELSIEQIRELANDYLGDVFRNEEEISSCIAYIENTGSELWLTDQEVDGQMIKVVIERVEE